MGAVEDIRQSLQDVLAPELRAIAARLKAMDKRLDCVERRQDRDHAELLRVVEAAKVETLLKTQLA